MNIIRLTKLSKFLHMLRLRFDKSPIDRMDSFVEFVHTRSAYVAQTSLYGYLKARMGRQYVEIFKDEKFAPSLTMSKWSVYTACLSDLSIYAVAILSRHGGLSREDAEALGQFCIAQCVAATFKGTHAASIRDEALQELLDRNGKTVWANAATGELAFAKSPEALANSSPVSEEFQELDREIVMNSVRFRWNNIRDEFSRRLDPVAVLEDWQRIRVAMLPKTKASDS